jgi:tRNA dimethylallyltransferase
MGPTASGKTPLALALARLLPVEIVSVDSAQVYRGMDVGTAKPSASEREGVPHHLVDIIDPTEAYSAARFRADALKLMREITARGRIPVLAGGTMLSPGLARGLSGSLCRRGRTRADAEAAARGWPDAAPELSKVDPQTAARLKPNDAQRIQRALEVFRLGGEPMSRLLGRGKRAALPFRLIELALVPSDRGALHRRIETRFDAMLEGGLVEEVRALRNASLCAQACRRCVAWDIGRHCSISSGKSTATNCASATTLSDAGSPSIAARRQCRGIPADDGATGRDFGLHREPARSGSAGEATASA